MKSFRLPFRKRFMHKWKVTPEEIENLKKDLEDLGSIEVQFYKSEFSRWSLENEVIHSEPSDVHQSNHVDILLDGAVIIQLLERYNALFGTLHEERIPVNLQDRAEHILSEKGYNVGKTEDPRRKRRLYKEVIFLSLMVAFLWMFKFLILRVGYYFLYADEIPREVLKYIYPDPSLFDTIMGILWLIIGIGWIYRYRKTSFKG